MKVDNAIILAAGISSRFAPLSVEIPKPLIEVRGEILIERQIRQLLEVGIREIYVVVGYKKEYFLYLHDKYGVELLYNKEYNCRNNISSIWAARNVINNTYICSGDNFFLENPFENNIEDSYYAVEYADGYTDEWCVEVNDLGYIKDISIGGKMSWYMIGHSFWSQSFSRSFLEIINREYNLEKNKNKLWENILMDNIDKVSLKIRKYKNVILEFDSLEELRRFDTSYIENTRSSIIKNIAKKLGVAEYDVVNIRAIVNGSYAVGFLFDCFEVTYQYILATNLLYKMG